MGLVLSQVPFQEITEFLQQLVSIPSVESEQAIATCVAEKLNDRTAYAGEYDQHSVQQRGTAVSLVS